MRELPTMRWLLMPMSSYFRKEFVCSSTVGYVQAYTILVHTPFCYDQRTTVTHEVGEMSLPWPPAAFLETTRCCFGVETSAGSNFSQPKNHVILCRLSVVHRRTNLRVTSEYNDFSTLVTALSGNHMLRQLGVSLRVYPRGFEGMAYSRT